MTLERIKEILSSKTVGIAGCGGLGSNCAVALARVGIGKLILVDFDRIEESNLNRQNYYIDQVGQVKVYTLQDNMYYINPDVEVEAYRKKLGPRNLIQVYKDCDVIVEAFDHAEMKQMIIETVLRKLHDIPLVVGVGMAGWGNNNTIKTRRDGNLYICGDESSEIGEDNPPLAPRVGIVANMQANTVLEILLSS